MENKLQGRVRVGGDTAEEAAATSGGRGRAVTRTRGWMVARGQWGYTSEAYTSEAELKFTGFTDPLNDKDGTRGRKGADEV